MTAWFEDPRERARYLDGEGTAAERAARASDLDGNPDARRRVEADDRFFAIVRSGASARPRPSDLLEARVRRALAADRAAGFPSTGGGDRSAASRLERRVLRVAAAAAVLSALGWWALGDRSATTAEAQNIRRAVQIYRDARDGRIPSGPHGSSCEEGPSSPLRFPIVTSGENAVESCATEGNAKSIAVLRPTNDARTEKGLVVVPWSGKSSATDVGFTRVKDVVVFDVAIGRAKYYLAVPWSSVAGTTMCAACHGPQRAQKLSDNPHEFVERTAIVYDPK